MTTLRRLRSHGRTWLPARAPASRARGRQDEQGAVLILALLLLVVGVIITGALSFQVTNDIHNSARFQSVRSLQYAARSSTDLAVQNIRYTPMMINAMTGVPQTLNASPPAQCWTPAAGQTPPATYSVTVDGVAPMATWCSTVWTPTSAYTRTVTFSTCLATVSPATCASQPLLQAVVSFDDYPPGISAPTTSQCQVYCGTSMFTNSWVWSPSVPTLTGISPSTGPITGGTSVTITGTGFTAGSTVSFVEESAGIPAADNEVLVVPSAATTVNSSTSITVSTPAATEGSTYYVVVTTARGSTAHLGSSVFTYTTVAPTLTSITPTQGAITGQTVVDLTGTGFFQGVSPSVVKFVQESNGTIVSGGVTAQGTILNLISDTSMTVIAPGVTTPGTYFVTLKTTGGTTTPTANDVFTYSAEVPTVSSISPAQGPNAGGTSIVISGTGFITGTTVSFSKVSSGCSSFGALAGSSVTIVGPNTITANTPSVSAAGQYYVFVTSPLEGASGCYPVYTYTG